MKEEPEIKNIFDSFDKHIDELLENMKDPNFKPGIANREFVSINDLLAPPHSEE